MNPEIISVQRASGKGRDPWLIRRWLAGLGLTIKDVAVKAATHHQMASDTIRGIRNHGRVLAELEKMGCPRELLYPLEYARRAA